MYQLNGAVFMILAFFPLATLAAGTSTIKLYGTLIDNPPCTINGGGSIDVPFGDDVVTTKIDGSTYKVMPVNYTIQCDNGTSGESALQLSITGAAAGFGNGLLKTDTTGLAVQFLNSSQPLALNTPVKFNYGTGQQPVLSAVLAKNSGVTLVGGAFSATATMAVDYQ